MKRNGLRRLFRSLAYQKMQLVTSNAAVTVSIDRRPLPHDSQETLRLRAVPAGQAGSANGTATKYFRQPLNHIVSTAQRREMARQIK